MRALVGAALHAPDLRAWVRPQLTDWSLNCFTSPLDAPEALADVITGIAHRLPGAAAYCVRAGSHVGYRVVPRYRTRHDVGVTSRGDAPGPESPAAIVAVGRGVERGSAAPSQIGSVQMARRSRSATPDATSPVVGSPGGEGVGCRCATGAGERA